MKAMVLHRPAPIDTAPLLAEDIPAPVPAADELLIRVRVCGICRTDLHVVEGELPQRLVPIIPGHQVVGEVAGWGSAVTGFELGRRLGVAWLHRTCGHCRFCISGRENLCEQPEFTGWTVNGGFAEYLTAPAAFVYPLPEGFGDLQAAPLLCAGIIGYRALRLTGLWPSCSGANLGIYGFGAAGHVVIQLARSAGANVYVCTRDRERHQALARELGAVWVGDAFAQPPEKLDTAIIFAPAGELVPAALKALDKGGTLVLGGIHMSPVPSLEYALLYQERTIRSVANNTRDDGRGFLAAAQRAGIVPRVQTFALAGANVALNALKNDAIRGAGVLIVQ